LVAAVAAVRIDHATMLLRQLFDPGLAQYSYLVSCQQTGEALVVDPQRDVERYLELAEAEGLTLVAAVETHVHADFLSGARELAARFGLRAYLSGEGGADWGYRWGRGLEGDPPQATLLRDGDTISVGEVELRALHTPGHTPEHLCFVVTDGGAAASTPIGLLSGDFLLVADLGRPDLLDKTAGGGSTAEEAARELFASLRRLEGLAGHLQVWPAHGAGSSCGKAIGAVPTSTIGYERLHNRALLRAAEGEDAFVRGILEAQPTPPTYFGRMKRDNRDGPPLLRRLPRPRRLGADDLGPIARHGETIVIDTRTDRSAFMAAHLPDALHAPADRSFSAAVGAVVTEPTRAIVLVVEESSLEDVLRSLVRIGYDRVVGYCLPATLEEYFGNGGEKGTIPSADFAEVRRVTDDAATLVVDVRDVFEFARGHVPGAVNAPYTRLPEYLRERIPAGRRLVVHCETGARSAVAAAWLVAQGRDVLYVDDDWSAWERLGGEVHAGAGDSPSSG
jgi:hydroxyacylglutathione hydrolase